MRPKESETHSLDCLILDSLMLEDFDFVRCANCRAKIIDGDAPFDGSGITQVYKMVLFMFGSKLKHLKHIMCVNLSV